jgi:cytochrome c biogenesis factor
MNTLQPTFLRLALQIMFVMGGLGLLSLFVALARYEGGNSSEYVFVIILIFVIILPLLTLWSWLMGKLYKTINCKNYIHQKYTLVIGIVFSLLHLIPAFLGDIDRLARNFFSMLFWIVSIFVVENPWRPVSFGAVVWVVIPIMAIVFAIAAKDNQIVKNDQIG